MTLLTNPQGPIDGDDDIFARVAQAIREKGYIILDEFLPEDLLNKLFVHFKSIDSQLFKAAGVGRDQDFQINQFLRRDKIYWLDEKHQENKPYFDWIEQLRLRLNRELLLGLFDYECHYAYFPEGAFYKKHLDAFKGTSNRRLTTVLYLNPQWNSSDGGELQLYQPDALEPFTSVLPKFGRMVIFLSEVFPHEVARANKGRHSLTGWFRINGNVGDAFDPPR